MVTPETSGPDEPKRPKTRVMGVGMLGLAAGLVVIITLTQPEPPPAADALPTTPTTGPPVEPPNTTSTTAPFRVADVISGPQIRWARQDIPGTFIDTHEHAGDFYLFTADGQSELQTWIGSGLVWKLYGRVRTGFWPIRVLRAGDHFIAFGNDDYGTPMAVASSDGATWESVELPALPRNTSVWLGGAAVANEEAIVLLAEAWSSPGSHLLAKVLADRGLNGYLDIDDDGNPRIVLTGPLGIPVAVHAAKEFGIDPAELAAEVEYRSQFGAYVGTSDATSWQWVVLADHTSGSPRAFDYLGPPFVGPDGRMWASELGDVANTFASADGVAWVQMEQRLPDIVLPWGGDYLSVSLLRGVPTITRSTDLVEWESVFAAEFLPSNLRWGAFYYPELAAGGAGVAMTARSTKFDVVTPPPVVLEHNGYRLVSDNWGLRLFYGDRVVVTSDDWWRTSGDLVARLIDDGLVVSHPLTGEDLVTFSLDDLEAFALRQGVGEGKVQYDHHVLIFSPDGGTWTIQDIGELVPPTSAVRLAVGDDLILAITSGESGTVVWSGDPPE